MSEWTQAMNTPWATGFVTYAVIGHGDDGLRLGSVQAVLDEAGFDATALRTPVFGGIWGVPGLGPVCEGPQADEAAAFLLMLTDTMQRGKFEVEVQHVFDTVERRKATA